MSRLNNKIHYYGHGIPYLQDVEIKGKLIILEGPDYSGRTTQISLLNTHLETRGHAVVNTGLRRSELISEGILVAKQRHLLGKRTMSLFYAADFADQLENKIIPALRAGYVVLADRYIYTLMARDAVRRIDKKWSKQLYDFAIKPDLIFYLDVDPRELVRRVFEKNNSLDYYESGEDLSLSNDILESFLLYQSKIKQEFIKMQKSYGIIPIDGNRTIEVINLDLQREIDEFLEKSNNRVNL